MTEELSSTINIVLVIFFIVAVVAIILMLIGIVKNMIGVGVMQFQGSASAIADSQFSDYDQKNIGGVIVKNAITQFRGQDVGIIVKTTADAATSKFKNGREYGALLSVNTDSDALIASETDTPTDVGLQYPVPTVGDGLKFDEASSSYIATFCRDEQKRLKHNTNTKPTTKSGYEAYIRDSAMFKSSLIYDKSGTKIGIYCEQIQ